MWKLVCPTQGEWYHIDNLVQVGEIYQYLIENYHRVNIRMIINSGDDIQGARFKNRAKVEWFKAFAKNWCGTGKLKIRIKEQPMETVAQMGSD